jgi:hypothetical protein
MKTALKIVVIIVVVVLCGFMIAAYITATSYERHVHTAIQTLEGRYQNGLAELKGSPTVTDALQVLQPFAQIQLPHLLNLGPLAWSLPQYRKASNTQFDVTQLINKAKSYDEAYEQLASFYDKSNQVVKSATTANTTTASGWKATSKAYAEIAALRRRTVTSPLLATATTQEATALSKMAAFDNEAASVVTSSDQTAIIGIEGQLSQLAVTVSVVGRTDVPIGFNTWRAGLASQFQQVLSGSQ